MANATDDFERGALGTKWTKSPSLSNLTITSSSFLAGSGGSGTDNGAWWNANQMPGDHYSEAVISETGGGTADSDGGGPLVRHQPGASTFYLWFVDGLGAGQMYEVTAGSFAASGAAYSSITVTAGTTHRLSIDDAGVLTPYVNGVAQATRTDTTIRGGAPGIHIYNSSVAGARTYGSWLGGPAFINIWPILRRARGGM